MANAYDDLYAWMRAAFGEDAFTMSDFRGTFPSPAPAKVLSDLRRLGYVDALERGVYRIVPAEERVARVLKRGEQVLDLPEKAGLPYAYCDDSAVTVWTGGSYWTGFTRGFRPIHIQILRRDLPAWLSFLRRAGARVTVEGSRETLFGVVHVLHPVSRLEAVEQDGVRVVPRRVAYAFANSRRYLYETALPLLRTTRGKARR